MAETITSVRGMNDLLPSDTRKWHRLEAVCRETFAAYGYGEIRTPIVESTDLFARGIGEATDIVEKEMYTFADRGGRSLTMRPEMTAGCARAYIEHSLHHHEPVTRLWYEGPMFRYERMQTGRYRQFWQIGCEVYGIAEAAIDAEQIAMLHQMFSRAGLRDVEVLVNSVGTGEDRAVYREQLVAYLTPRAEALCGDCKRRLHTNPMRVLDCKVPACRPIIAEAPLLSASLGDASNAHFEEVTALLSALAIPFRRDETLVRGLDYYTGTVFEMKCYHPELGAQSTVAGGGRYNTLVESLGGPATPAMGFAFGVERAILCMADAPGEATLDLFIASLGDAARKQAIVLAHALRPLGLRIETELRQASAKAQFKRADKLGAAAVLTLGDDELAAGTATVKHLREKRQVTVSLLDPAAAAAAIKQLLAE
ncbi:MAG: histidine--tRNA ligase [Myxococcales bacterium]|nr:histidine--tRNA ligase [Myxococcales bacterium]